MPDAKEQTDEQRRAAALVTVRITGANHVHAGKKLKQGAIVEVARHTAESMIAMKAAEEVRGGVVPPTPAEVAAAIRSR